MNRAKRAIVSVTLGFVGLIHIAPVMGIAGAGALTRLYGVANLDPTTLLLLRHRAVLFGILGAGMLIAAFRREWQTAAIAAGLLSTLSFVILAWFTPEATSEVQGVIRVDLFAITLLIVAAFIRSSDIATRGNPTARADSSTPPN